MSTIIRAGAMTVIDDTVDPPVIVFNSDEKLFNCTDLISGSYSFPARSATSSDGGVHRSNVNIFANQSLATVNPEATTVLGSFQVTTFGGTQGLGGIGVFAAGGTYMHYQGSPFALSVGSGHTQPHNFAAYTFFIDDGVLYLNEHVHLDTGGVLDTSVHLTITLLAVQFDYKLFVGTLT